MKSKTILLIHTIFFFSFAGISFASPFLMSHYSDIFTGKAVVMGFAALALLVVGSWPLYGGECPFTVWEHRARKREGKKSYRGACINHYAKKWFGLRLHKHASTVLLIALFLLPVLFGLAHW